ncbi:MAG: hypothetical protein NZ853_05900 [Leptospiraceae bacterium]|nr:hypothetical protein [Leptospiraceae bacterium]MDW7976518.1 hypothetical protein [Leptospiraceae bacterium]
MNKTMFFFVLVIGSLGFIISLLFSLFSQNSLYSILISILISVVLSSAVGLISFLILKHRVPELIEGFEDGLSISRRNTIQEADFEDELSLEKSEHTDEMNEIVDNKEVLYSNTGSEGISEELIQTTSSKDSKPKHFGDHILIDKITIKNEPKLMAQAIRTMLAKDE